MSSRNCGTTSATPASLRRTASEDFAPGSDEFAAARRYVTGEGSRLGRHRRREPVMGDVIVIQFATLDGVVSDPDGEIAAIYRRIARRCAVKIAESQRDMTSKFPNIVVQNT